MAKQPERPRKSGGGANFASCVVATIFLIFVVIILLIVFFTLFKPKDPSITVNAVQLPSFSITNNTASFTFAQYITVRNPNRAVFAHYDSTMQLVYSGNQVGFIFVPAGKIDAGRTEYMAATFKVESFPIGAVGNGATLEIESRMEMVGRVRVLHFFMHRVEVKTECRVAVRVSDGSVLGFRC
ncbi:hypothetical protein QQ045_015900 [Rhodiola kirilowii]